MDHHHQSEGSALNHRHSSTPSLTESNTLTPQSTPAPITPAFFPSTTFGTPTPPSPQNVAQTTPNPEMQAEMHAFERMMRDYDEAQKNKRLAFVARLAGRLPSSGGSSSLGGVNGNAGRGDALPFSSTPSPSAHIHPHEEAYNPLNYLSNHDHNYQSHNIPSRIFRGSADDTAGRHQALTSVVKSRGGDPNKVRPLQRQGRKDSKLDGVGEEVEGAGVAGEIDETEIDRALNAMSRGSAGGLGIMVGGSGSGGDGGSGNGFENVSTFERGGSSGGRGSAPISGLQFGSGSGSSSPSNDQFQTANYDEHDGMKSHHQAQSQNPVGSANPKKTGTGFFGSLLGAMAGVGAGGIVRGIGGLFGYGVGAGAGTGEAETNTIEGGMGEGGDGGGSMGGGGGSGGYGGEEEF